MALYDSDPGMDVSAGLSSSVEPSPPSVSSTSSHTSAISPSYGSSYSRTRRSRASRACENCRKRKVKCSEGDVCNECRRFGETCHYRQHYRAKREFSVKILQSPDFIKKERTFAKDPFVKEEFAKEQFAKEQFAKEHIEVASPASSLATDPSMPLTPQETHAKMNMGPYEQSYTLQPPQHQVPQQQPPHQIPFQQMPLQQVPLQQVPLQSQRMPQYLPAQPQMSMPHMQQPAMLLPAMSVPSIARSANFPPPPPPPPPAPSMESPPVMVQRPSGFRPAEMLGFADQVAVLATFIMRNARSQVSEVSIQSIDNYLDNTLCSVQMRRSSLYKLTGPDHLHDFHLTEEQMLQTIASFAHSFQPAIAILDPDVWTRKAKSLWRAKESGMTLPCTEVEAGIIYLLIALGCLAHNARKTHFAGVSSYNWAVEYCNKARATVPDILGEPSLQMVQYMMLYSKFRQMLDQERPAYLYATSALNMARTLRFDRLDPTMDHSPEVLEKYRTAFCAEALRNYTSLRLGQISLTNNGRSHSDLPLPELYQPAFHGMTKMAGIGYMMIHSKLVWLSTGTLSTILQAQSLDDIVAAYSLVNRCVAQFDAIVESAPEAYFRRGDVETVVTMNPVQAHQWALLHLFVWHIKTTLYRPFLLLLSGINQNPNVTLPTEFVDTVRAGAEKCVQASLMTVTILSFPSMRVGDIPSCWLVSGYLLMASRVLIFYFLCLSSDLEDNNSEWQSISGTLRTASKLLNEGPDLDVGAAVICLCDILERDGAALAQVPRMHVEMARTLFLFADMERESDALFVLRSEESILNYWQLCLQASG